WAGRWASADPAGAVDGLNLYRMCRNNPVTFRDSNGLLTEAEIQTLMLQTRQHMSQTGKDLESVMHNILGLNGDDAAVIRSRLGNTLPEPTASTSGMSEITALQEQIAAMSMTTEYVHPHMQLASPMAESLQCPPFTSSGKSDEDIYGMGGTKVPLPAITPELLTSQFPDMSEADRQALEYIADPENFSHTLNVDGTVFSISKKKPNSIFRNNYTAGIWTFESNHKYQPMDGGTLPYFASHIAQYQYLLAAVSGGWVGEMPFTLIRENVINKETLANTAGLEGDKLMSVFFNNTPNGKSTAKILQAFKLSAISVEKEYVDGEVNFSVLLMPEY
ncbi:RHS repeat protein, partial [Salmonella enterica]|nr:RHS repeat protein [Salmonella enterica]